MSSSRVRSREREVLVKSEAVASLRSWAKDRLGDQEEQLRQVERSLTKLGELDQQRAEVATAIEHALEVLTASGLDESQVCEFVGVDQVTLRAARTRSTTASGRRASRPATAVESP